MMAAENGGRKWWQKMCQIGMVSENGVRWCQMVSEIFYDTILKS